MQITVWWAGREEFAKYVVEHTILKNVNPPVVYKKLLESDANNAGSPKSAGFHSMPDHIKQILYLDAPDLIVELDGEPIFSVEESREAGTGHNPMQRFSRLAASVENGVPALYIYPEAVIIERKNSIRWDQVNPNIFAALDQMMHFHQIPALLFFYPSYFRTHKSSISAIPKSSLKGLRNDSRSQFSGCPDSTDSEMIDFFNVVNLICSKSQASSRSLSSLMNERPIMNRRSKMRTLQAARSGSKTVDDWCPLTTVTEVSTQILLKYMSKYEGGHYVIGDLLRSRSKTLLYSCDADFRSDPYPGTLAVVDYLKARTGRTFEDRDSNLVMVWGKVSINSSGDLTVTSSKSKCKIDELIKKIKAIDKKNLLNKDYRQLKPYEIPRYYMQVRYGSTFSKSKDVRIISYFADAILFPDGALWRDG